MIRSAPTSLDLDVLVTMNTSATANVPNTTSVFHERISDASARSSVTVKNPEVTIEQIAEFSGIGLDDELRAITLEHSSLPYMQEYKDRFDDAMMRKKSEESVLPEGSDSAKVRVGKSGDHTLSAKIVETLNQIWRDTVTPVTGFDTYEELIASLG